MNISQYIKSTGAEVIAKRLGVNVRRVKSWQYNQRKPKAAEAIKLVQDSGGMLSMVAIYEERLNQ